jgi:alpha-glucosidase
MKARTCYPAWALAILLLAGGCGDDDAAVDAGSGDGAADAGADAGALPAHCWPAPDPVPPGATFDATEGRLAVRCLGHDLHVTALEDGMLRLSYVEPGGARPGRSWAIESLPPPPAVVHAGGMGDSAVLCTEHLAVSIEGNTCRLVLRDFTDTVLLSDDVDGGWQAGTGLVDGVPMPTVSVVRHTPAPERFYGLGERNGPLDRRGTHNVFWNTDAYDGAHGGFAPDADPLYQSIPLLIGLREGVAYGVFTDNPHRLEIDVAQAAPDRYSVTAFGGVIDQYVLAGGAMSEVIRRYTRLTGRLALPPRWSLGYHQCRWGYSPDTRLTELAAQFRSRQLPADALWLDIQHMDGFRTFSWDPVAFADPAGLAADLAADGFQLTVIADPGIKVDPGWSVFDDGLARDVFLREPGGALYVGSVWPGDAAFPDFTSPDARGWWGDQVATLAAVGVRGIWLDVNEPTNFPESGGGSSIPNDIPVHGEGLPTTMAQAHNVYALQEARATYEGLLRAAPERRPFILSRAAYAGIQRYAAAWTGDAPSTWTSLAQTLPMLLNMSLSGEPSPRFSGGTSPTASTTRSPGPSARRWRTSAAITWAGGTGSCRTCTASSTKPGPRARRCSAPWSTSTPPTTPRRAPGIRRCSARGCWPPRY